MTHAESRGSRGLAARECPTRIRRCRLVLAIWVLLPLWGCGGMGTGGPRDNPFARGGGDSAIVVVIENLNFNEATVDALTTAGRARLGRVPGKGNRRFTLPWNTSLEVRLQVSVLAGRDFTTESIAANPGDILSFTIQETGRAIFRR